jgi:crotonobetainyl-CoA:carnitine CoA-transferase CaiB-like acyl-CoA transferase
MQTKLDELFRPSGDSAAKKADHRAELLKLLKSVMAEMDAATVYTEANVQQLKDLRERFLQPQNIEVGQVVKWKTGLKNKRLPKVGQPAIVMEVFEKPITPDERDSGSPYYLEPLDLILGVVDEDRDFVTFYYDKRRFEPF